MHWMIKSMKTAATAVDAAVVFVRQRNFHGIYTR